ncbi:septum site-determining protein MinD [Bacillus massiliigorillae]|uniref:septum site-determining protein MinD n=1 Tax=Bacillus massiliigorillae TaxID=1243664 RepID=UPI0003A94120|nr:septum site-determining protein MinD [Bacillus massiliigorillae]
MGEAIVITSGKGGVGKTTSSANIGTALALSGKKVCLVDTDIGLRNLDVIMGMENRIVYDIVDVVEERCKIRQALVVDKRFDKLLYLLPAAQTSDKNDITPEQMKALVAELKQEYDYVIIDCPAGIERGFRNAVAGADRAIVVTTPERASVRDADRVIGLLEKEEHIQSTMLIVNRIRTHLVENQDMMSIEEVIDRLYIELLGVVVDDDMIIKSSHNGVPITMDPNNPASLAFRNIARRILGDKIPLMNLNTQQPTGMFAKFKKMFGVRS